jgi:hypothetical protein
MLMNFVMEWVLPGTLMMILFAICVLCLMPICFVIGHVINELS